MVGNIASRFKSNHIEINLGGVGSMRITGGVLKVYFLSVTRLIS